MITNIIKKAREANNLAVSYATSNCFVPPDLRKEYESHHSNAVHISLRTDKSIEEEFADPIQVDYREPKPVCVCPDLGEENLVTITDRAYHVLKGEAKLTAELERQIRSKQGSKSVANVSARHSVKEGTHEGGTGERTFMAPVPPLEMMEFTNDQDRGRKSVRS